MGDLRDWLAKVDSLGELKRVEGADWNLEMGYIMSPRVKGKNTSVLLFDNIEGYPSGYRVVVNATNSLRRTALTLNIPEDSAMGLVNAIRHKLPEWEDHLSEYPPKVVDTGPVLENMHSGDDLDLFEFPVPKWYEQEGGRYIGTADAVITRDPDTGQVNFGTYRVVVHDKKTAGLYISPGKHGRLHYEKYHAAGKPCPIAVSCGHHPLIFTVSGMSLLGCEYNWAGAIRRQPIEVITEEVTGLPIPADSEIVIAGWCPPGKMRPEGPFGEWPGYYAGGPSPSPVIEVERIYHRNDPVILGWVNQRPPLAGLQLKQIFDSAIMWNELEKMGIPDVKGVWESQAALTALIIISIKQRFAGHAKRAALIASQSSTLQLGRYIIVVDEDIDPTDIEEVIWAVCFRSDPEKDIDIIRRCRATILDPLHMPGTPLFTSMAIIDACKPYERLDKFPPAIEVDPRLATGFGEKWKGLFQQIR